MSEPESYIEHGSGGTSFVGPSAVEIFRATVIKSAIRLYGRTGIKANRAYTPKNMLAAASQITGKKFKRGQFEQAEAALEEWIGEARSKVPVVVQE